MIDHHSEYTHGLASDMRRRHLPASASQAGWDFSDQSETQSLAKPLFWAVVVIVVFGGFVALAVQAGLSS